MGKCIISKSPVGVKRKHHETIAIGVYVEIISKSTERSLYTNQMVKLYESGQQNGDITVHCTFTFLRNRIGSYKRNAESHTEPIRKIKTYSSLLRSGGSASPYFAFMLENDMKESQEIIWR